VFVSDRAATQFTSGVEQPQSKSDSLLLQPVPDLTGQLSVEPVAPDDLDVQPQCAPGPLQPVPDLTGQLSVEPVAPDNSDVQPQCTPGPLQPVPDVTGQVLTAVEPVELRISMFYGSKSVQRARRPSRRPLRYDS